jgi:putative holliday junction resolvase
MKYLGVDYGKKKIGIATSNEQGTISFPQCIVVPDAKHHTHINTILELCDKEKINDIVIGHSVDYTGKDNPIEKQIAEFITHLSIRGLPLIIHRFDERMSTSGTQAMLRHTFQKNTGEKHKKANAKKVREHTKDDDAQVAAYILQGFLDMQGNL